MEYALILAGDSPIGIAIAQKLVAMGYPTISLGADFSPFVYKHKDFHPTPWDPSKPNTLPDVLKKITDKADVAIALTLQPTPNKEHIASPTPSYLDHYLNQTTHNPLLFAQTLLPHLVKTCGQFIQVAWKMPTSFWESSANAATKQLSEIVFQQARNQGVSSTTVWLDPNWGTSLTGYGKVQSVINPDRVANLLEKVLLFRSGNIISEITLTPQSESENTPIDTTPPADSPYSILQLPKIEHFPKEAEPIRTPRPQREPLQVATQKIIEPKRRQPSKQKTHTRNAPPPAKTTTATKPSHPRKQTPKKGPPPKSSSKQTIQNKKVTAVSKEPKEAKPPAKKKTSAKKVTQRKTPRALPKKDNRDRTQREGR